MLVFDYYDCPIRCCMEIFTKTSAHTSAKTFANASAKTSATIIAKTSATRTPRILSQRGVHHPIEILKTQKLVSPHESGIWYPESRSHIFLIHASLMHTCLCYIYICIYTYTSYVQTWYIYIYIYIQEYWTRQRRATASKQNICIYIYIYTHTCINTARQKTQATWLQKRRARL